jgi:hypothetical protein
MVLLQHKVSGQPIKQQAQNILMQKRTLIDARSMWQQPLWSIRALRLTWLTPKSLRTGPSSDIIKAKPTSLHSDLFLAWSVHTYAQEHPD